MTADKARKRAARRVAADAGLPYTAARRAAAPPRWDDVLIPEQSDLGFVEAVASAMADEYADGQLLHHARTCEALAAAPADPEGERPGHRRRRQRYARMAQVYRRVLEDRGSPR
jgi:hypothetical protein